MAGSQGRFVWYEVMTTDPAAAKRFYGALMGWEVEEVPNMGGYALFKAAGAQVAGVMLLPDEAKAMGAPPSWSSYVAVADVDATTAKAQGLGATVLVPPTDIPGIGRFSMFQDPQGAAISTFMGTGPEPDFAGNVGEFTWHELATSDVDAAMKFYGEIFGWVAGERMDMGEMGPYQMFGPPGVTLGGIYRGGPEVPMSYWLPYARVPDIEQAAAKIRENGGAILVGPMEVPGGDQIVQLTDPQGAMFAVHAVKG